MTNPTLPNTTTLSDTMTAEEVIDMLGLEPHPEGGYFRQTWIETGGDGRPAGTCIYFLLKSGGDSHWHYVDSTEIWHHYAGAPVELRIAETDAGPFERILLGPDLAAGQRPQGIVPVRWWQAAGTTGDWSLVGCTVSPAFDFAGFVLAEPEFDIPG